MKTSICFWITIIFVLTSCNKTEEDTVATCFEITDKPVPQESVSAWVINWAEQWTLPNDTTNCVGGIYPAIFARKISDFKSVVDDYNQFRIYYAFCKDSENNYYSQLLLAPLNDTCSPVFDSCIFRFMPIVANEQLGCVYSECNGVGCPNNDETVAYQTAIDWTANYREHLGVSTTDSITTPFGDITYMAPLAFNYDTESFFKNIEPTADSIKIFLGLEKGSGAANEADYRFKLLFGTSDAPGKGEGADYVDFASPCPLNCSGNDPLL